MSLAALRRVFYWCCLFPKGRNSVTVSGWTHWGSHRTLFCTVIFLCVMGSMKRIKTAGQPCSSGEAKAAGLSFRKGLCCIVWQKPRGQEICPVSPIWCLYHLLLFFLFIFFFKIRNTKGEMVAQWAGAKKFLWMWWEISPSYKSIPSCSISLLQQWVGYHVFQQA